MKKFSKEIKIALTAIVAVALLFYGINFLKGINLFKTSSTYYVVFNDITGLSKNNPVYAGGYPVGTVQDIRYDYDHPGRIIVRIDIDQHMKLPKGCTADLVSSMLGTTTMNLRFKPSDTFLQPGASLTGAPYLGALEQAGNMIPKIEQMLPKLDSIMGAINALLADEALTETLHNTAEITSNLKQTTNELNKLMGKDLPQLTAKMNRIGDNVETMTAKLKDVDYAGTIANVNATIEEVKAFTASLNEKINSNDNNIGLLLNDRQIYDGLTQVLTSTDALLTDLKGHPKRYVHFSLFGKKDK